jgi:hypothetical protein
MVVAIDTMGAYRLKPTLPSKIGRSDTRRRDSWILCLAPISPTGSGCFCACALGDGRRTAGEWGAEVETAPKAAQMAYKAGRATNAPRDHCGGRHFHGRTIACGLLSVPQYR